VSRAKGKTAGPARGAGSEGAVRAAGGDAIVPDVGAACRLVRAAVANDEAAIDAAVHGDGVVPDRLLAGMVALVLMQAEASPGGLRSLPRFLRMAEGQAEAAGL
jgi:hypothetical protein